ncbi:MAG: hypothetical protein IKS83_04185 [Victivallales bacterium]|nr:hypothetical protein [Victivallales bacterium]
MKRSLVWLGVLALAGMLCGCDTREPSPKEKAAAQQKQAESQKQESQDSSVASEVGSVIDYGIGVTQTRALKQAKQQIHNINDQHNRELEQALGD